MIAQARQGKDDPNGNSKNQKRIGDDIRQDHMSGIDEDQRKHRRRKNKGYRQESVEPDDGEHSGK